MNNNPCQGCEDRWIDISGCKRCHTTCEKYIDYQLIKILNKGAENVVDKYLKSRAIESMLYKEQHAKENKYIKHKRKVI